jgi:hypothetical protein
MKTILLFAMLAVSLLAGCEPDEQKMKQKPGLQPGEIYDTGGAPTNSATNTKSSPL